MWGLSRKLSRAGVLGINKRNGDYLLRYNQRRLYPRVDDKSLTKILALEAGVAVPELFALVEFTGQVRSLAKTLEPHKEFVIKPARGCGGEGILVITERTQKQFRKASGELLSIEQLQHHVINILSGMYSLAGHPDKALIEYRVKPDHTFSELTFRGVPDIRTVVFFGVPVACMMRLPTQMSDGKANLHQGAVGVGIEICSGTTIQGVWLDEIVYEHPDTTASVCGVKIPSWEEILTLSSRCYDFTEISYQGVDIVVDDEKGPMLLEVNARPGLNVQIANNRGLVPRLNLVAKHASQLTTPEQRTAFAMEHFSAAL